MPKCFSKLLTLIVALAFLTLTACPARMGTGAAGSGFIDIHVHLWKGMGPQIMPGGPSRPLGPPPNKTPTDYEPAARNLIAQMDSHGVATTLVLPPPRPPEQFDTKEFDELAKVVAAHPGRLAIAGGGESLNPLIYSTPSNAVTVEVKKNFELRTNVLANFGVKAFGEMAATHLSFSPVHPFLQASPDHPLFLLLADIAARRGIPIDWHMEAVPQSMPLPPGFAPPNPSVLTANIPAFKRLLTHNPKAKIVWQHIGWDNTGYMTVDLIRQLLKEHPNLYLALRVEERTKTMAGTPMPNRIIGWFGRIKPEWLALFMEFPDRFVIGSDECFGTPGLSQRAPQSFDETWAMLAQMPPALAAKIGHDNAKRIYGL